MPLANLCEPFERGHAVGELRHDLLERRRRTLPILTARVVQREVQTHVGRFRRDRLRALERIERLLLVSERGVRAGEAKRGVEIVRVALLDLLEERNRLRVLPEDEEDGGFVQKREERRHVGGTRRVAAHDRLHVGRDIPEARKLAALLVIAEVLRRVLEGRKRVVVQRRPDVARQIPLGG